MSTDSDDIDSVSNAELYAVVYTATKDAIRDTIYNALLLVLGFVFLGAGVRAFLAVAFDATNVGPNVVAGLVSVLIGGVLVTAAFDALPRGTSRPDRPTTQK